MTKEVAAILRWPVLLIILIVIVAELNGNIANWVMGLILVPLLFAFLYLWQLSSRKNDS